MITDQNKNGKLTHKRTPQRLAILDFLEGNKSHPSAEDIYQHVSLTIPTITRATVYNTIDALIAQGMVAELRVDAKRRRYDPNTARHQHLICTRCGSVRDLHAQPEPVIESAELDGFHVSDVRVEIYGVCKSCAESKQAP